ncbi:MAG: NfeD family protein [Planctomycetota bacterium]|jgi:membrane-bound serine protease (ClpP class)|nr:NfeD family protein [Planctomycetota bacterium]MEC8511685.1 NfeD family protein [Planctomycetota bacterium]
MTTIILLFGLGLALVVAEVFIPSMGVLGMLAGLSLMTSIGMAFYEDAGTGTLLLVITAVSVPLILTFGIKLFPRTPLGRKITARGFSFEDGRAVDRRDEGLAGARGVVEAQLRPAGIARIDGRRVDVVSRGEAIDAGIEVVVVEVSGNRVIVARAGS